MSTQARYHDTRAWMLELGICLLMLPIGLAVTWWDAFCAFFKGLPRWNDYYKTLKARGE